MFKFSLESILSLRQHKTLQAKNQLGRVIAAKVARLDELKKQQTEIDSLRSLGGMQALSFLQARFQRISHLEDEMFKLEKEIMNISEIEDLKRDFLSSAMKEEKTIDKLKENEYEAYKYKMNKLENEELSEIALRKFYKQS
jgi:flagellar protein FliJ